jgi:GNAT superfamily N-acetyltransferase
MANAFDQFDSNPFDQFDDQNSKTESQVSKLKDVGIGLGEAGLMALTGGVGAALAPVPAALKMLTPQGREAGFEKNLAGAMEGMTYEPRTETGQDYGHVVGDFINRNVVPIVPMAGAFPHIKPGEASNVIRSRKAAPQAADAIPSSARDVIAAEKAKAIEPGAQSVVDDPFSQMKRQLDTPQTNEGPFIPEEVLAERQMGPKAFEQITEHLEEVPAREADKLAAERQAQVDFEVKRQATLDYNAAERARQEAAPTGFERSPEAIARDPDVTKINEKVTKQEETVTKLAEAVEGGSLPKNHLDRALRDLGYMEDTLANMKQLVEVEVLDRTQTRPGYPAFQEKSGQFIPKGERGAINPEVFKEGFEKLKQLADGTWLRAYSDMGEFRIEAIKDSHKIGETYMGPEYRDRKTSAERDLQGWITRVDPEHQRKGIASEMYKFASELGNDVVPSAARTDAGKAMWQSFENNGLAKNGVIHSPGNRQRGAIWAGAESVPPRPRQDTPGHPTEPATIADRQQQRQFLERFPAGKEGALDEFRNITTKEEALELSKNAKDISKDIGQKQLSSGINFHAAMSNSPALKFARYVYREARVAAEQFSHKYVTEKNTGLTPVWSKMRSPERISVMEALMEGDRQQFKVNEAVMDSLGFNENQRQFVKTFYEANEALWNKWLLELEAAGIRLPKEREGHFPGIFTGSYKTLVMIPKFDKAGNAVMKDGKQVRESAGVIATDTKWQQKTAREYFLQEHPDATFVEQQRTGLSGSSPRYFSDIFSGMNDILDMLGREDPRFADVQALVQKAIVSGNNKLFNFNVHELSKKGVKGNEGNRPWLSPERNADDAFKALVRYFEEGATHHELQVPLKEVRELMNSPELDALPNTKKYLDRYTKKVTGADLHPLGAAVNTFIDAPFRMLGIGPSLPLKAAGVVKNNMSHIFMGYGNYMFTLSQLIQPGQTGLPFMQLAAKRLGLDTPSAVQSMGRGGRDFLLAFAEEHTGKKFDLLDDHMRQAYQYARERGLLTFSELERAYQGTQGKASQLKDKIAEANMKVGENATRTPMFMAFTDLLVKGGIDVKAAMPIAEHMTQLSMVDYHPWERPMLYSKAGVLGDFAGGLQTFKHGLASQQTYLGKQLVKPAVGDRQIKPIAMSVVAMLALGGVTGTPFYNELNTGVMYLTDKFGDGAKSIREIFLQNSPEWFNSGVISNAIGLNIQSKFSSADMIPDSAAKAASPHLEAGGKIIGSAIDIAMNGGDEQSIRNLITSLTPSGLKGFAENALSRDEDNYLIGRDGLRAVHRTDKEWEKRMATGLRPHKEALERESTWLARIKEKKDTDRKKEITQEYERRLVNNTLDDKSAEKLRDEYMTRGGDINQLLSLHSTVPQKQQLDQRERMQGIPKTLQGAQRYERYSK